MQTNCDVLVPSLRKYFENNLGKVTLDKIEQRLFEKHGTSLGQSIKDFSKFDSVLKEFFGAGAAGLESRFIQSIIKVESLKEELCSVTNEQSMQEFLKPFADKDKKILLQSLSIKQ